MRIDFDPMIADFRCQLLALPIKNDESGLLLWHMAIDAVAPGLVAFGEDVTRQMAREREFEFKPIVTSATIMPASH
jgi:hypothetical protein